MDTVPGIIVDNIRSGIYDTAGAINHLQTLSGLNKESAAELLNKEAAARIASEGYDLPIEMFLTNQSKDD